jgi:hypothetical protein
MLSPTENTDGGVNKYRHHCLSNHTNLVVVPIPAVFA